MGRRRGFFAELAYQQQQAERRRRQQEAASIRAYNKAVREAQRAQREAERARTAAARASAAEQKAKLREAERLHAEAQQAKVDELNTLLARDLKEIDGLLEWTLAVDDYVDLESLKVSAQHPRFDAHGLDQPSPEVPALNLAPAPVYVEPVAPKGLASTFGGKKRHAAAVAAARLAHQQAMAEWEAYKVSSEQWRQEALAQREQMEAERSAKLSQARRRYDEECEAREKEAKDRNAELDGLINGLAFDLEDAITTYVGIVLANSVYPDHFPVEYDYSFDLASRELDLTVTVPDPSVVPTTKAYRWVKASDEITSTALPIREQKARYANAVWQIAVRTIHEVFEADRAGKIHSISLTTVTKAVLPATGQPETIPLVLAAVDRDTFLTFDLANVIPRETLVHLGAALSKSPFDLTPADTSRGIRARKK